MNTPDIIRASSMGFKFDLTRDSDCLHQFRKHLHKSSLECTDKCDTDNEGFCQEKICTVCLDKVR